MAYTPRSYQQEAHDAVVAWWKHTTDSCVIEAATGAGKSLIIAMLADTLHKLSHGKRVLCLAPSAELIEQNSEKFKAMAGDCSIYSASIDRSLRHKVVFATEGSFYTLAKRLGHEFAGVIIDEAHRTTNRIKTIISDMKEGNPNLRVCGLSATPYRQGEGFIFAIDSNGNSIPESKTRNPYFKKLVYTIGANYLIEQGFLTPARIGEINAKTYDTSGLKIQKNGQFSASSLDQAFTGWGRETSSIVADIVAQSADKRGVIIFAASVEHAKEVLASLPPSMSRMIGGTVNMGKSDRRELVHDFKNQRYKYLVNVKTMTTGVDFTHVDVVAVMTATESISLLQQMIGRGLRLHEGKHECVLLDYADNIDRHCPDGDLFRPEIKAAYQGANDTFISCECPECGGVNTFSARKNEGDLPHDEYGYFVDLDGEQIMAENTDKPMPAHYGRRCQQYAKNKKTKEYEQCGYFWSSKECPSCGHHNDIAARRCKECKDELINPNDKLIAIHHKHKRNPSEQQNDEVLQMDVLDTLSRAGNAMLKVTFFTPYRMFTTYYHPQAASQFILDKYHLFDQATSAGTDKPRTVTYYKNKDGFYETIAFNRKTDDEILKERTA